MDSIAIKAIVNAAGDKNIEIRSTDASVIYTKAKGVYCYFNFDKSCLVCMRSNDNASTYIKSPMEVTVWDFNDINHMTIVGDMNDTLELLEEYSKYGLITSSDLNKFKEELVKNEALKSHNATTSIENYDNSLGNKAAARNVSGYGNINRMKRDDTIKPEIIKLGKDKENA